ncbi:acyl-CoA dehydrogenase family protein [Pyruvatibacter mobilis]|jgi:acyl-CoA dehydrogenase|uniref:Cyclohexane-1-carbonyl-CoA dehydrogenase n=1 Tax=Pyruvatibacter mobilis TaxID=1712261 RepID=A0A845QAE9_9HYPH|nr:acyl-CoA dehydrogenase family protein [Pyruvatibacter mobilis]NBG95444.1 acyl-CoA dehydrogenase [Pyruvatibacter mobilis]QJD75469.1 acyl-CoA dehydrogenase [Pyruvatibacter mobilis]GGD15889.1 acyl-CoA dehydrogenase [Pyruvatibacter mobilis]
MSLDAETRQQLLDSISRFVRERLRPLEDKVAEDDAVPAEIIQEMRELGLFGLAIPEEFGGLGLSMEDECLTMFEMGKTSPAFRSVFGTNVGIGSQGIVMFGTDEQKSEWLPGLASGEIIASFALTEPEAGSDAGSVRTTAVRDGDDYVINGTKRYITNANKANVFTLMARTNPDVKGAKGVSSFIVPSDLPGISLGAPEKKMGQQGAHICDVNFDNVRVPARLRLGDEGMGFINAMQILERGRLHISAVCVGVAERLIADCVAYAAERKQFGQPIGEFQLVQGMLADSKTEAYAGRCMVMDAARRRDAGEEIGTEASCSKYFCSEMVGRVADRAVQIYGGAGYIADYGIERLYRDVRIFRLYEGTSQIQQVVIARNMLRDAG